jgi:hypothetical protein
MPERSFVWAELANANLSADDSRLGEMDHDDENGHGIADVALIA